MRPHEELVSRLDEMHETWVDLARRDIVARQTEVAILRDSMLNPAELAAVLEVYQQEGR